MSLVSYRPIAAGTEEPENGNAEGKKIKGSSHI
jgi:hypothetical protein